MWHVYAMHVFSNMVVGQSIYEVINGVSRSAEHGAVKPRHKVGRSQPVARIAIGEPEDFRRVSSIIDVDILPPSQRRVRLMKNGSDRPLGFYIRDGTSIRVTPMGLEKVPGVFISRLVPGGLAESTGLLAVNDEVLEVNGIDVTGKTLDQVCALLFFCFITLVNYTTVNQSIKTHLYSAICHKGISCFLLLIIILLSFLAHCLSGYLFLNDMISV